MGKSDDKLFEELLEKAFCEQYNEELNSEPTMEEMNELYPVTSEQEKEAKRLSQKQRKPLWISYMSKVASIVICVCLVGFGGLMLNPGIRATVGEFIVKSIEEGFNIDFTEAHNDKPVDISKTEIGYIPEGFELIDNRTEENKDNLSYSYINAEGEYIVIDVLASSDIELYTDDDHHELKPFNLGKYRAYISYSHTQKQGSVYFGNQSFTVAISGMTDRDELIKIAENIEIKE